MRPDVKRILKLVEEGKLSADDAAELIEAFEASSGEGSTPPPTGEVPPQAPPTGGTQDPEALKPPWQQIVETIERLGKEVSTSVDWHMVARQAREGAQRGVDAIKIGVEQVSRGRIDLGWIAGTESKDVELPLAVAKGKILKIENPCGDVKVRGTTGAGSVSAHAKFKGSSTEEARQKAEDYILMIEEGENSVVIRQPDMTGMTVELEVNAPEDVALEIRTGSGDIDVADMKAGVRISGKSGDVKLKTIEGPIELSTASGDISIQDAITPTLSIDGKSGDISLERVHGNANVRTASGDVSIRGGNARSLSIECVSGDVDAELDVPVSGSVSIRTVSGDALVKIPAGSDCRVTVSTLRGDATVRATLEEEARAEQRVTGKLGDGNGSLDISAVTGDVTLEVFGA